MTSCFTALICFLRYHMAAYVTNIVTKSTSNDIFLSFKLEDDEPGEVIAQYLQYDRADSVAHYHHPP